uniref:Uncharacterized protein n=1 Tax=Pyramimonas obovata TaxID=1411642 RepID=A0A7S0QPV7_9CHLO|mmetsp:Transcript_14505/g.31034  ORF Transcript_14505/g.31034 Transcript_14505/m.31034 type:complete len:330 (+) Transcript_14505:38-1027(+)
MATVKTKKQGRIRSAPVKPPPWQTDSSARPFVGEKAHRHIPSVHEHPQEGGHLIRGGVKPDYITSNAQYFGPTDSTALKQRRLKKNAVLDECVTRFWTTTNDAIGANYPQFATTKDEARAALAQRRSKVVHQTHNPWATDYSLLGQGQQIAKKDKKEAKTVTFNQRIDWVTTQMDYGQNCDENPLKKGRTRNVGYSNTEPPEINPWVTSTDTIGGHHQKFVHDKSERTRELNERIRRQALDPVSHGGGILEHPQQDILGQVDRGREETNYLKKQREGLATAFNTFMVSDVNLPRIPTKQPEIPENYFPKSTQYKIRKQLQNMNINPEDL